MLVGTAMILALTGCGRGAIDAALGNRPSKAPELVGTQGWINSAPLELEGLRGKVVLIDFWTYTCVNCIRTFPFLKVWHSKYADNGLVVIGVHTPEFEFEKKLENVQQAVEEHGIDWPVVQDNDFATWRAFDNQAWPAKYLIDKNGEVRYQHLGEGRYRETERYIRTLLLEAGADLSLEPPLSAEDHELDSAFRSDSGAGITAELYGGHRRGCSAWFTNSSIDDATLCRSKEQVANYQDPGEHKLHKLYLQGDWFAGEEALRHGRQTTEYEDYMVLSFAARSVNVVLAREGVKPFEVVVTLDGTYLTADNRGEDVVIDADGQSYLVVDQPRMYSVVQAERYGEYKLKLSSNSTDFALFAFTFGVYAEGI